MSLRRRTGFALAAALTALILSACATPPPVNNQQPPAAPSGLAVVAGDGAVTLSWNANDESDLAGYGIYRATAAGAIGSAQALELVEEVGPGATEAILTGLSNGQSYRFAVDAVDEGGDRSALSAEVSATPAANPQAPSAPTGLNAVAGDGAVTLSWNANGEGDLAGYGVYQQAGSGLLAPQTFELIAELGPEATGIAVDGLSNGQAYRFAVDAVNDGGLRSALSAEVFATPAADPGPIVNGVMRIAETVDGLEPNGASTAPALSHDGRYLAFASTADNLVENDNNGASDVFVLDLVTGDLERVSVASDGSEANGLSQDPDISGDGRYVVFESTATNLSADDGFNGFDVYRFDRQSGEVELVSYNTFGSSGGGADPAVDADGDAIAFVSTNNFMVDDDDNTFQDVFVRDMTAGENEIVSIATNGDAADNSVFAPDISGDGNLVVFVTTANSLDADADIFNDIFLRDRAAGTTTRVNVVGDARFPTAKGDSQAPSISPDGTFVAFMSSAYNLAIEEAVTDQDNDVFLVELATDEMTLATRPTGSEDSKAGGYLPSVSDGGSVVVFYADLTTLVPGDTNDEIDVFAFRRASESTVRLSVSDGGDEGDAPSLLPVVSGDGSVAAFQSSAATLVPNDDNGEVDVFAVPIP